MAGMRQYDHKKIEKKWQEAWRKENLYKTEEDPKKPKAYVLDMFPYPSGEGLHVGHPKGYIASDIYSRFKKMSGYNILHPMGWDAFGLPAENYAIKNKIHPKVAVEKNIAHFKEQLEKLGLNYDWEREINTTDPKYYKWTQWIFLQLWKKGLAYESHEPINWCPSCKTGLAFEDLEAGKCERCGSDVEQRPIRQWVLKIREYADRLLEDLSDLEWPEHIKESQRNWIGRSEGAEIEFKIQNSEFGIKVFTTRPDTLFGATYMVLSPEHPLVTKLASSILNTEEVNEYVAQAKRKTDLERTAGEKEKTGVELKGVKAINPANKEALPVWIADYVLAHYGTGAIMAVPAHDERDFAFAQKFGLPIREVIEPVFTQSTEPGKVKEGLPFDHRDAIIAIVKHWSEEKYMALKWKQVAWGTFITGGIEKGQTAESAARAEIEEETGYQSLRLVHDFGIVHGKFYHVPKKVNRFAHSRVLLFQLEGDARVDVTEEEQAKHEVLWLTLNELKTFLTPDSHQHALEMLCSNGVCAYTGGGILKNSGTFDSLSSEEAKWSITEFVGGERKVDYKLRDWVFSRQRYWGEPIPMIHCSKCGVVPVAEKDLPVVLPDVVSYEPTGTGESPLAAIEEWVNVACPNCGGKGKRETNTMPQWAGSSWYYLRFIDPHNNSALVDKKKEGYWSPIDLYEGGVEHATRHLIYARFWHKFLYDIGVVNYREPFGRLKGVGLIYGEDGRKMSKRWGNVVNPDDVVSNYGADTLRLYEMFMGPFEESSMWSAESIIGPRRFLEKVWRLQEKVNKDALHTEEIDILTHKTIKKVTTDIEAFRFNTAVSAMMVFVNSLETMGEVPLATYTTLLLLLYPFAPHITEELWHMLGNKKSLYTESWPNHDETKIKEGKITVVIQVNGKVRGELDISPEEEEYAVKEKALAEESVKKWTLGKEVKRVIYVQGKLVNIVAV
ncbi:MAG: leucine--tRNA ligase [Parcubacteria group bacterium]|nr:leucine--tRNA ligase [Parcubacteria group bacterium]